jgi:phosphotransferase system HPr-like phosphotransfer protein
MPSPSQSEAVARRRVLDECAFAATLSLRAEDLRRVAQTILAQPPAGWTERDLYFLYQCSTDLETFLDDQGARRNEVFFPVREAVARVRWLALASSALAHLHARAPTYRSLEPDWVALDLLPHAEVSLKRLGAALCGALQSLVAQWHTAKCSWDLDLLERPLAQVSRSTLPATRVLDPGGSEGEATASSAMARFLARYLRFTASWSSEARVRVQSEQELVSYMERFCTERIARVFETRAHNLQSEYDSILAGSREELDHPELPALRSAVSQCFHLLEAVTALSHLYERHWVHERDAAARDVMAQVASRKTLLQIIVNDCIIKAYECMNACKGAAEQLLQRISLTEEREFLIPDGISLHARPLSWIVAIVNHHGTQVQMEMGRERANAASMMSLLVLSGGQTNSRRVKFYGSADVLQDLEAFFQANLGERGVEAVPLRLRAYLGHS